MTRTQLLAIACEPDQEHPGQVRLRIDLLDDAGRPTQTFGRRFGPPTPEENPAGPRERCRAIASAALRTLEIPGEAFHALAVDHITNGLLHALEDADPA